MTAIAVSGSTVLAGNAAGVFKKGDKGWERLNLLATEVQAIALGESDQDIAVGSGGIVDVSHDGGETWERTETDASSRVTSLSIAGSSMLAGTDAAGVFASSNGGKSWRAAGLEDQMVLAVSGSSLAGTDQGLWQRGADTGFNKPEWKKLGVEGVVTAIAQSGKTIVVGTEEAGLFRSADDGKSWQPCANTGEGINAVSCSGDHFVAVSSAGQVFDSTDAGKSWKELPELARRAHRRRDIGEIRIRRLLWGGLL